MSDPARPLPQRRRPARHRAHPQTWPLTARRPGTARILAALAASAGAAAVTFALTVLLLPVVLG
ncbi:hypothetical protein SAMN05216207_104647 [Pseudonocardia ammonioxydans]|uniref:Uncharacterized protein n=1 Tax=Pseudonocardia ammonioxydans TaxID=260086 RepID=A0A1I5GGK0_PSUAM|nr:hypothetical protein [Pseudonocardia ammonioxydans]SFO35154.1 hypothetical protein SAMN05216207_104647 [Pseudonocardia ammonioxydans]